MDGTKGNATKGKASVAARWHGVCMVMNSDELVRPCEWCVLELCVRACVCVCVVRVCRQQKQGPCIVSVAL